MTNCMTIPSPVGALLLTSNGSAVTGLWLEGQKYYARTVQEPTRENPDDPALRQAQAWLRAYFAGEGPLPPLPPLDPAGTPFQRRVWDLLQAIPYGSTTTYGALARELGLSPAAARAVGSAVGHNPISILIPCHRVLGANGRLTGYAGGLERKQFLLDLEAGT
ncbi:MAG: methylated-DNA--[protein]-cysteine S-methyltransferase [Dysosmobacter sp.]